MSLADPSLAHEVKSALAWWQMAGVDCDFADDACAWLAAPASAAAARIEKAATNAPAPPRSSGPPAATPNMAQAALPAPPRRDWLGDPLTGDLAAFRRWWMETPDLASPGGFARVPPRGEAGAALMVLVPQPEESDRDQLLGGQQGRLLDAIIAAMGFDKQAVYIAAALPCHTPLADLADATARGLDAVMRHHLALVRPQRLLLLGTALAPLLGTGQAHDLREINHAAGKVPAMASETLEAMMNLPQLKARFWRRWIEWSGTD
jgi:DNA polymerase